ncbi:MAG: hypothetical protein OXR67_13415 [Chloroflexota bacterium]|nr:hypothetical protein [Chloroflexota bacterium]
MTEEFDRAKALLVCFRNLKGAKSKELLLTARALQYLKQLPEFGSNQSVGEAVGVSGEIVRQFIGLLELPMSTRELLEAGVLGLEHGRRLGQIARSRPEIVDQAAMAMTKMKTMDARDLTEYLVRNPSSTVDEGIQRLEEAKQIVKNQYHVSVVLDEEAYELLTSYSQERQMRLTDLATSIIIDWLGKNEDN